MSSHKAKLIFQQLKKLNPKPTTELKYDSVFDVFKESIARYELDALVSAHRGDSSLIEQMSDMQVRLAFIDGDHSYEAVCQDIRNVERVLVKGGWICFDDAFSHYDGVNQAIQDLIINNSEYELCQQMTRKFFIARRKV